MLYKVKGKQLEKIDQTRLKQEGMLEADLEDWVENDPSILGENLLVIGRQVQISEVKDRIDLLALDTNGNTVIIELKKGKIKDPVDIQSLRYASYISRWEYNSLENQAKNYFSEKGEDEFNFNEKFEDFCSSAGIDEVPDLNQEQRIIIVGSKLKEKLGSVALWLREHRIDIKVIEASIFKNGEDLLFQPQIIIPIPTAEKFEIGKRSLRKDRPWLSDGEDWHLNHRCGKEMKQKLIQFNNIIKENFETIEGPNWNQKFYVSFKEGNRIWIHINTRKTALLLHFLVKKGDVSVEQVSKELGLKVFDKESPLSEKLQLESSVEITSRGEHDRVKIRIKKEFDVSSEQFLSFVNECFKSFKRV